MNSGAGAADETLLRFGDFVLCRSRGCLCRGRDSIHLRGRAFNTLVFLVENRGRTLTRGQILDSVWPGLDVVPNVVDHAITEIRHALGDSGVNSRVIHTVAGEGYGFIAAVEEQAGGSLPCATRDSLAIVPFATLGLEPADTWLGLGLADVLIARISAVRGIPISPLAAVSRCLSQSASPLDVGRALQAVMVLEGAIQRSGEIVRVTSRLLRVSDGKALWAATYDEKWRSIFSMEDAICRRVIQTLLPRLDGEAWKD